MRFTLNSTEIDKLSKDELVEKLSVLTFLLVSILLESNKNEISTRLSDGTIEEEGYEIDFNTENLYPNCITTIKLHKK